jgi:hypothetical protein
MSIRATLTAFLDLMRQHPYRAHHEQEDLSASFSRLYRAILHDCENARPATLNRLLKQLAAGIDVPDILNAGVVANLCGIVVESGGDPNIAVDSVLRRFTEQLAGVQRVSEPLTEAEGRKVELICEQMVHRGRLRPIHRSNRNLYPVWVKIDKPYRVGEPIPLDFQSWMALRDMGCAAMTMLCRSMQAREAARANDALLTRAQALQNVSRFAYYIAELLSEVDAELVVLHPGQQAGFRVIAEGIRHNFQLSGFLQETLMGDPGEGRLAPGWPEPGEEGAALEGDDEVDPEFNFNTAAWTYYQWTGLQPDGSFAPFREIWHRVLGELTPLDIQPFEGDRVVILGPFLIPMSWDISSFSFPALHEAHVRGVRIVERLPRKAVRAQLDRIRKADRPFQ